MKIIQKEYQRLNLFINNDYWKEITFPSQKKDWEKFESNNKSTALNVLFAENDKEQNKSSLYLEV